MTGTDELPDDTNSSRDVYADSAYRSVESVKRLNEKGYRPRLKRKGSRHKKLTGWEKQGNRTRAKTRCRVEHIFGVQAMTAGNLILRTTGLVRARMKIGLRNPAYNMNRYKIFWSVMEFSQATQGNVPGPCSGPNLPLSSIHF